jgi:hypothetical protein
MELKIGKATAKKLYPESSDWFREQLIGVFGEECFRKMRFDEIKTFEDACDELCIDTAQFKNGDTADEIAYKKLKIIVRAINQGWTPDWNNGNQRKWWPWFNLSSGFGFSASDCVYGRTFAGVGSRLCFESEEKSDYAAKQFIEVYKDFLT